MRPSKGGLNEVLCVRIDEDLQDRLEYARAKLAKETSRPVSVGDIVRLALRKHVASPRMRRTRVYTAEQLAVRAAQRKASRAAKRACSS